MIHVETYKGQHHPEGCFAAAELLSYTCRMYRTTNNITALQQPMPSPFIHTATIQLCWGTQFTHCCPSLDQLGSLGI